MRYQVFGKTGLRVSKLVLGTGNFGVGWGYGSEASEAARIYDAYRHAGGNFIDTSDQYQFGQSEEILGGLIQSDRDGVVVGTKFSMGAAASSGLLRTGNSRLVMQRAVEDSLRRLKTDRIDILWVHFPDFVTPIEEIARGLDDLVRAGKIVYAGLSNFPAWRVASAVTLADLRGFVPISAVQVEYNLIERSIEREILPMSRAHLLEVVAWSPMAGGLLTGKYRRGEVGRAQGLGAVIQAESDSRRTAILDTVLSMAAESGWSPGQIAVAWVMARGLIPIIGPRTLSQAQDNLAVSGVALSTDQIDRLTAVSNIDLGYPHTLLADVRNRERLAGGELANIETYSAVVR